MIVFSLVLVYALYPILQMTIVLWFIILAILSLFRVYVAYLYEKHHALFLEITWYKIFVTSAFLTATLFSLLGSFGLFYLDEVKQIFVVAALIGLTAGAMSSLFPDIRIVIGYISIILIPLIVSLLFTKEVMNIMLSFLIMVYFIVPNTLVKTMHFSARL